MKQSSERSYKDLKNIRFGVLLSPSKTFIIYFNLFYLAFLTMFSLIFVSKISLKLIRRKILMNSLGLGFEKTKNRNQFIILTSYLWTKLSRELGGGLGSSGEKENGHR